MEQVTPSYVTVGVELDTSFARMAIFWCRFARFVIGRERAQRLAMWAALRLTRWRVSGMCRWQWLSQEASRG